MKNDFRHSEQEVLGMKGRQEMRYLKEGLRRVCHDWDGNFRAATTSHYLERLLPQNTYVSVGEYNLIYFHFSPQSSGS